MTPAERLVYADELLTRGDVRGEILVLESRVEVIDDYPGWRQAAERLLRLTARHGFPVVPDDPDASLLSFDGGGSYPVQYEVEHAGVRYYVRYRGGNFSVDDVTDPNDWRTLAEPELPAFSEGEWTDEETNVILHILSDAIRAGTVEQLVFPDPLDADPRHRRGLYPRYGVPWELKEGWMGDPCTLAARDRDRWMTLYHRWSRAK
jgi:hypothetical protein